MIRPDFLFNQYCTIKRATLSNTNGDVSTSYENISNIPCRYMLITENEEAKYGKNTESGRYGVWLPFYTEIHKTDVIYLQVENDPEILMQIDIKEIDNVQGMGQFIYIIGIEVK